MAGQTAQEKQLSQAFLSALGAPDTATNELVVTAWMRQETGSGTTGVGKTQNNLLGLTGVDASGKRYFLTYATPAASMVDAANRLKATTAYGYPEVVKAFQAGNDPGYIIRVLSQSSWDASHYGWNPQTGGHLQGQFQALGGNLYTGTPLAGPVDAAQGALGAAGGAVSGAVGILGFGAQAAAFVADPQNWLRMGALALGVILTGAGGYILWQAT